MDIFHSGLTDLIQTIGYIGIFFMVFAESGLFFGFFFPGDSLLFTAGFLASQNIFDIKILVPLMVIGAVIGDSTGFWMGGKFAKWLMTRRESFFFKKEYIERANKFYNKHGGKALIMARFVPAVRTFVPIVAGMANMEYKKFISFNVIGGLLWGAGITLLGYYLGNAIPDVEKYLLPIIGVIIVASVLPGIIHMRHDIMGYIKKRPFIAKVVSFIETWVG
jgi:membrane-associated protein